MQITAFLLMPLLWIARAGAHWRDGSPWPLKGGTNDENPYGDRCLGKSRPLYPIGRRRIRLYASAPLLQDIPAQAVLADKGYDSNEIVEAVTNPVRKWSFFLIKTEQHNASAILLCAPSNNAFSPNSIAICHGFGSVTKPNFSIPARCTAAIT